MEARGTKRSSRVGKMGNLCWSITKTTCYNETITSCKENGKKKLVYYKDKEWTFKYFGSQRRTGYQLSDLYWFRKKVEELHLSTWSKTTYFYKKKWGHLHSATLIGLCSRKQWHSRFQLESNHGMSLLNYYGTRDCQVSKNLKEHMTLLISVVLFKIEHPFISFISRSSRAQYQ